MSGDVDAKIAPAMTPVEEEEYLLLAFVGTAGAPPAERELVTRALDVRPLARALAEAGYYGGAASDAFAALEAAAERLIAAKRATPLSAEAEGKRPPEGYYVLTRRGAQRALEVRAREVGS